MNVQYEIVEFNPNNASIRVKYFTEEFTEGFFFNFDVPVVDGKFADQEAVNAMIEAFKPVPQIERVLLSRKMEIPSFLAEKIVEQVTIVPEINPLIGYDVESAIQRLLKEDDEDDGSVPFNSLSREF
jgi:hypothetical protein